MLLRRALVLLACLTGLALIAYIGFQFGRDNTSADLADPASVASARSQHSQSEASPPPSPYEARLQQALRSGVTEAAGLGGTVEAAAMLDGSPEPLVATSEPEGSSREVRMWSISKVATMVALLRGLGWRQRPGETPSPEVESALEAAIGRSENCRQRRVVLELQRIHSGIGGAREAMAEVFTAIGARAEIGSQVDLPESLCQPFLHSQHEIEDPLAPGLLLGTSKWRIGDAVRLAHALATGAYGEAISTRALALMRAPKRPSRESLPGELTAPLDWGAGIAFAGLDPAYKAGWGGSLNGNFLAGQIAVVPLGENNLAIAVMFHPATQPSRDDPGITAAPAAVETVMESFRDSLQTRCSNAANSIWRC